MTSCNRKRINGLTGRGEICEGVRDVTGGVFEKSSRVEDADDGVERVVAEVMRAQVRQRRAT